MVYEAHKSWREYFDYDCAPQDIPDEFKKEFKALRKRKVTIPYTIEVECNSYWGNFEREFIAYSMGVLDEVQMHIDHSDYERMLFWHDIFPTLIEEKFSGIAPGLKDYLLPDMEWCEENYELLKEFLLETVQECDDWYQLTFYGIDWEALRGHSLYGIGEQFKKNILYIQLAKPLTPYWENIIIPRMKLFFQQRIYKWMDKDAKLISIKMYDKDHNLVKEY